MSVLANRYVAGALAGLVAAALVDLRAFQSWKSVDDAVGYNWRVAVFRWVQGAVMGALMAAGIDAAGA